MKGSGIERRGKKGLFTLARKVPKRYWDVETRRTIFTALKTDNTEEAERRAKEVKLEQDAIWEARIAGDTETEVKHAERLALIANQRGHAYQHANVVATQALEAIMSRIAEISSIDQAELSDAVLGASRPAKSGEIKISNLFETYFGIVQETLNAKNEDQKRRWANPRHKAIRNFINACEDYPVTEIPRSAVLDFRVWWRDRIGLENLSPNSANKDFSMLSAMVGKVYEMHQIDQPNPFAKLKFPEMPSKPPSFSREWIETKLLAPDSLKSMNSEARGILLMMINTGARPNELAGLDADDIKLSDPIPHIHIRPNKHRDIKNRSSERLIPLVGVSLDAARENILGFPRYQSNSATLSATVMKYLRSHGLLETEDHVFYSLRHTIQDSLQNVECQHRTTKEIMGHTIEGVVYGDGASLETKLKWLQKVAFHSN